MDNVVNVANS